VSSSKEKLEEPSKSLSWWSTIRSWYHPLPKLGNVPARIAWTREGHF